MGDDQAGARMSGIGALLKGTPESSLASSDARRHGRVHKPGIRPPPDTDSAGTLILGFPVSTSARRIWVLFISIPICGILLHALRQLRPKGIKTSLNI